MSSHQSRTVDVQSLMQPDALAHLIANLFVSWNNQRSAWLRSVREVRDYVFATSTRTTTNSQLPWKNSTTIPKLCQIRDNLHANYMAALFPNSEWIDWEGDNKDSVSAEKARAIKGYVKNKAKASDFEATVENILLDWVDTGNVFATIDYQNETRMLKSGETIPGYAGPKLVRISPFDIVFNPTASDFNSTPKIIRTLKSMGELKKDIMNDPSNAAAQAAFQRMRDGRANAKGLQITDALKEGTYIIDGFGSYAEYLNSGTVEILTLYGDLYDQEADKFYENHIITIVDRCYVLEIKENPSWLGKDLIFHHGWRKRPDNLYAMGPLDNLVGMQYRIDHLENLKADAFDMIAFPVVKIKGECEHFDYRPGEKIYVGDGGDVDFLHPDVAALSADNQIDRLEMKMEQMAGAPKEALGIRTPGEKTAYEVQSLENAAGRMFQNKVLSFEREFLTKILNGMLEVGRRNLDTPENIKVLSSDIDVATFMSVSKDDLQASGKIRPVGASHFAKRAQFIQNLTQYMNSIGQDPAVQVHLSGKALAKAGEVMLDLDQFTIYGENVRIFEGIETERLKQSAMEDLQVEGQTDGLHSTDPNQIPEMEMPVE
jgi:hypothetical protein